MGCPNTCSKKPGRKAPRIKVKLVTLQEWIRRGLEIVVAYGGGTDSTALVIHLVELGIPIKAILFADTGGELKRTYNYVGLFSLWLQSKGYPAITIVKNVPTQGPNKGTVRWLYEALWSTSTLPPVAFGRHTCSHRFKIVPQDRWIDQQVWAQETWADGRKVLKLIGFEVDEGTRINRTHPLIVESGKYEAHYPLVEWGWTREKCVEVIRAAGLPQPGKSACYFCPMRSPEEIRELAQEEPEKLEKALALEARALESGKITSNLIKGLGGKKGFAWRDLVASWAKEAA